MGKGLNSDGVFVDTGCLRNHVSKLRKEKQTALELYNKINSMKDLSDPADAYQYTPLIRDAKQMVDYFDTMIKSLTHIEEEAISTSKKIAEIVGDDIELSRKVADIIQL